MRQIKVLVVEDSLVFRELLVANLNKDPAIQVVATATDPYEARDKIIRFKPDVMTLDIELPKMSGLEFLRKLMPQYPMPVIVLSALSEKVFDAMQAGAVDFVAKPVATNQKELEAFLVNELPVKIKVASTAKISRIKQSAHVVENKSAKKDNKDVIIAIGASTGGTEAIASVVKEFPADVPGTVIVQHMPAGFTEMYAKRLDNQCKCRVKEAENGDVVEQGLVLLAPGGRPPDVTCKGRGKLSGFPEESTKSKRSLSFCGCSVRLSGKECWKECNRYYFDRYGRRWSQGT